jgi:hypothetical protein
LLSLVQFASEVSLVADFSPISEDFENATRRIVVGGDTALWNAIAFALENLEAIRSRGEYPNAMHYRILVFSDGNDQSSTLDKIEFVNRILATPVFVDSIHLTTKVDESCDLARLSKGTGGFSFKPAHPTVGLRMFEKESFLMARLPPPRLRESKLIDEAQFNAVKVQFEDHIENPELVHVTRTRMIVQQVRGRSRTKRKPQTK